MTKELSNKIKAYNLIFILAIFVYHSDVRYQIPGVDKLVECWGPVGLSFFFMLSGFFMFRGMNDENALSRSLKRIKTLLVPYLFFNILFFAYFCIRDPFVRKTPAKTVLFRFLFQPYNDVMWYLATLFLFSVPAFLVYRIIKKKTGAVIFGIASFLFSVLFCVVFADKVVYGISLGWWLVKVLFYIPVYYFGGMIGLHKSSVVSSFKKLWPVFLFLFATVTALRYFCPANEPLYRISLFAGPVFAWYALPESIFKPARLTDILCEPSFFIYEFQLMAFWIWQAVYKNAALSPRIREILICTSALAFIYILFYFMKRFTPHLLAVVTGFRSGKDFTRKKAA